VLDGERAMCYGAKKPKGSHNKEQGFRVDSPVGGLDQDQRDSGYDIGHVYSEILSVGVQTSLGLYGCANIATD
jgi:hypothetical protein